MLYWPSQHIFFDISSRLIFVSDSQFYICNADNKEIVIPDTEIALHVSKQYKYISTKLNTDHHDMIQCTFTVCFKADLDSRLAYPRPRPRLSSFKTKTKTKTLMSKTKTKTQDLQDQYWKSTTGIDCDKQKD